MTLFRSIPTLFRRYSALSQMEAMSDVIPTLMMPWGSCIDDHITCARRCCRGWRFQCASGRWERVPAHLSSRRRARLTRRVFFLSSSTSSSSVLDAGRRAQLSARLSHQATMARCEAQSPRLASHYNERLRSSIAIPDGSLASHSIGGFICLAHCGSCCCFFQRRILFL